MWKLAPLLHGCRISGLLHLSIGRYDEEDQYIGRYDVKTSIHLVRLHCIVQQHTGNGSSKGEGDKDDLLCKIEPCRQEYLH